MGFYVSAVAGAALAMLLYIAKLGSFVPKLFLAIVDYLQIFKYGHIVFCGVAVGRVFV